MRVLRIEHLTEYRFDRPVTLLPHRLLLRPRESHRLKIASLSLDIEPAHELAWSSDMLDNAHALATFREPADCLRIDSRVDIEHYDDAPLGFLVEERALTYPFAYSGEEARVLAPFRRASFPGSTSAVQAWLRRTELTSSTIETYALLNRLNIAIHESFSSQDREEEGVLSPDRTLAGTRAACRDLAALFIDACRSLGLASRFVSGYLHAPASQLGHGSTHAWAEVYIPGPGWKGFDPTLGALAGNGHVAVAVAMHPESVPPVSGSFAAVDGGRPFMRVRVRVQEGAICGRTTSFNQR